MKKVAVQKGLSPVKNYLENSGYSVKEFDSSNKTADNYLDKFDAVVVTGESENIMGMEDTTTSASIINADGMTPEDIKNEIERKF